MTLQLPDGFLSIGEKPRFIKALFYGHMGAGKTRFCADAPDPVWFDFENSTETLYAWPEYRHIPVKTPTSQVAMQQDIEKIIKAGSAKTIVIDSLTTILDSFLMKRASDRGKNVDDVYEGDYKAATQVFKRLLMLLTNAPINVVVITHERITHATDDKGNEMKDKIVGIYPDVTPALQKAVTRLVNVVGYLKIEPSMQQERRKRKLYLNPTATIEAKNRLNIQETFIENPTWKDLFNA